MTAGAGRVLVYGLGVSGSAAVRHLRAEGRRGGRRRRRRRRAGPGSGPPPSGSSWWWRPDRGPAAGAGRARWTRSWSAPVSPPVTASSGWGPGSGWWGRSSWPGGGPGSPMVAVTGTNGKTTVTTLVAAMLVASGIAGRGRREHRRPPARRRGRRSRRGGGRGLVVPAGPDRDLPPAVAAWVNFSEDHLDWHQRSRHYREAKARVWANSGPGDVVVANAEDPVVHGGGRGGRRRGGPRW